MKAERVAVDFSGLAQFKASALLTEPPGSTAVPLRMRLDLIDFDPKQPRRTLDPAALEELAASIKDNDVLEPVSLRSNPTIAGRFIINRGERRVRASRLAGLVDVPYFLDERVDPYAQVIENEQREDLSLFDLATFVVEREAAGDSRSEIARRLGKPRSLVTELGALREASPQVRAACAGGRVADSRSLYLLARAEGDQAARVVELLAGAGAISRSLVERALAPSPASAEVPPTGLVAADVDARPQANGDGSVKPPRPAAKKLGIALVVEHEGRRGCLTFARQPGKRSGEVLFEDGTRETVNLQSLKLLSWATG